MTIRAVWVDSKSVRSRSCGFLILVAFLFVCAAGSDVCAQDDARYEAAAQLDLLPTPRVISLSGEEIDLTDWTIVIPPNKPWACVAAREINSRIEELGGQPLKVQHQLPPGREAIVVGRWWDPHIRSVSMTLDVELTPTSPGEQGYVIASGSRQGGPIILLGGSDTQGVLYASVTFRRLIQEREERVVALEGRVRDWPDYKLRVNGELDIGALTETDATLGNLDPLYEVADQLKAQVDFYFRHKINGIEVDMLMPDDDSGGRLFQEQQRLAEQVLDYAHDRRLITRFQGGVEVGPYLSPEEKQDALERDEGTSYMWSALGAHRRHAEDYGTYMPDNPGMFSLHPYDGGGYLNPERWNDRNQATREMYGDNRALADLEQFLLYFEVLRERHPRIGREAVVYPYHYQFARDDFPEKYAELAKYMPSRGGWYGAIESSEQARDVRERLIGYNEYLNTHLPDDVYIVFREGSRRTFDALTELYPDHPITMWVYPARNKGWLGTFAPQVRMAKTWFRSDHRDLFYLPYGMTRALDGRPTRLAQQEYLWNVDHPDASAEFQNVYRRYAYEGKNVTDFQKEHLIPRIARILYGNAWDTYEELIARNLSVHYVSRPKYVASVDHETEYFEETYAYMGSQAEGFQAVFAGFSDLVEGLKAGESATGNPVADAWTVFYYRYTGLAAVKAQLDHELATIRGLVEDGRMDQARTRVESTEDAIPQHSEQVETVKQTSASLWNKLPPVYTWRPPFKPERFENLNTFHPSDYEDALHEALTRQSSN